MVDPNCVTNLCAKNIDFEPEVKLFLGFFIVMFRFCDNSYKQVFSLIESKNANAIKT